MSEATLIAHCGTTKVSREELKMIPVPESTRTFKPIPHYEIVDALVEALGFRYIGVVRDEYAVSPDGMKMFGVLDLETAFDGCRFAIGIRNANDRSMRLGLTSGLRVFVCDNLSFQGEFTPVLAKHSKNFSIVDSLAIGVDRIQRNFDPLRQQVETWRSRQITDEQAKLVIYRAFIESELSVPRALARDVHRNYFEPDAPGVRASHDVVPLQRVHIGAEVARSDSVLPGDCEARNVPPIPTISRSSTFQFLGGSAWGGQSRAWSGTLGRFPSGAWLQPPRPTGQLCGGICFQ